MHAMVCSRKGLASISILVALLLCGTCLVAWFDDVFREKAWARAAHTPHEDIPGGYGQHSFLTAARRRLDESQNFVDDNGNTMEVPEEGSNRSLIECPTDGLIFKGWSKDTWGGLYQLQVGDRVKAHSPLLAIQMPDGSLQAVTSPEDGVVIQMASLDLNTELAAKQPLVVLESRPKTLPIPLVPDAPPSQDVARAKVPKGPSPYVLPTDDDDSHGWPLWVTIFLLLLIAVLVVACLLIFLKFANSDDPCSTKDVEPPMYGQESEQALLLDGISRAAHHTLSEPAGSRPMTFQDGLPIEFETKDAQKRVIYFLQRPLGMKFYKSWWKCGLKVAGFTNPSHAKQQGVEAGWTIAKVNGHAMGTMEYKEATEFLKNSVAHLPMMGADGDEDTAIGTAASLGTQGTLDSFQRLPQDQAVDSRHTQQSAGTAVRSTGTSKSQDSRRQVDPQAPEAVLLLAGASVMTPPKDEPPKEGTWDEAAPASTPPKEAPAPAPASPVVPASAAAAAAVAAARRASQSSHEGAPQEPEEASSSFPLLDARRPDASTAYRARFAESPIESAAAESDGASAPSAPVHEPPPHLELEFLNKHNESEVVKITHRPLGMTFYKSFWKQGLKVAGFKKGASHARDVGIQAGWTVVRAGDVSLNSKKYKEAVKVLKDAVAHLPMMEGEDVEDDSSGTDSSRGSSPEPGRRR